MSLNQSIIMTFFLWYLKEAPLVIYKIFQHKITSTFHYFSIDILAKTLFAPWKKDVVPFQRGGIEAMLRIVLANLMTRVFGFILRTIIIFTGSFYLFFIALIGTICVILWYFAPIIWLMALISLFI